MTPLEAAERIALSKRTLYQYVALLADGMAPTKDLPLIEAELQILSDIAGEHPGDEAELIALVIGWVNFREELIAKMHYPEHSKLH